jgi:hypothetical protein
MTRKRLLLLLSSVMLAAIVFDVAVHRQPVKAQSSRIPYDRGKYYTQAPRGAFTFLSRYTLTSESMDHTIHIEATEAEDTQGHVFYARNQFNSASDLIPLIESAQLIERSTGNVTTFYWSRWQETLDKPMLVANGINHKVIPSHTVSDNNCTSPEPALKFVRYEPLQIGEREYPTAVVQAVDNENSTLTTWHAMTPELGCLELKSVVNYTSPEKAKGMTVHEPVSLKLGEPDPALIDIQAKIGNRTTDVIPLDRWDATVKTTTMAYKAAASQPSSIGNK